MFWDQKDTAGPTTTDLARFWDRKPRYLRTHNREKPPPYGQWDTPTSLLPIHAPMLAAFWSNHYRGPDWYFSLETKDVNSILSDTRVCALGLFDERTAQIVATVVGRPLTDPNVKLRIGSHSGVDGAYTIEGLCVNSAWRGKHLAGWLISWVDFLMGRERPRLYLWSRESLTSIATTNIACAKYSYIRSRHLSDHSEPHSLSPVDWNTFCHIWALSAPHWFSETALFPLALPQRDPTSNKLRIWHHPFWGIYIVLSDTRRRTDNNEAMWEVVWCGSTHEDGILHPWNQKGSLTIRQLLTEIVWTLVSEQKTRSDMKDTDGILLFATDVPHQGGASPEWACSMVPWVVGTSGYHQTYIYNFMPPAFWSMTVMTPHWEL